MTPIETWTIYFAGLVSIKSHPRNDKPVDLVECAKMADKMVGLTMLRYKHGWTEQKENMTCLGS